MQKLVKNRAFKILTRFSTYILQVAALVIILKYSGLANSIVGTTQSLTLKSGLVDADPDLIPDVSEKFDYDFTIKTLNGDKINASELKGKVIFLNLWATWCGPCRAELPGIQSLYTKLDSTDVEFVILSIDNPGQEKRISNFIKSQSFTFPVYVPSGYLTSQLSVPSIPTTFVVDKEGKIVVKKVGMTNFDTPKFQRYIEKLAE